MLRRAWIGAVMAAAMSGSAKASLMVLVGEPFGSFGTMMPNGHASIYLDRVCADGPLKLRMCRVDEPQGVVIARLNAIGPIDWIASPVMPFLYGVEVADQVLPFATAQDVRALQQDYRRRNLLELYPDGTEKSKLNNEWWETVGVAFIRRLWGYQVATTREQDEAFVAMLNAELNRRSYHLHRTNCADFAADAVNFYFPGTVKVDHVADFGVMSPKQVVRGVYRYGEAHPEARLRVFEIPQIPGTLRRSRPVRGGAEALLNTKRYLVTLLVIQPEAVAAILGMYIGRGRWAIGRGSEVVRPEAFASTSSALTVTR